MEGPPLFHFVTVLLGWYSGLSLRTRLEQRALDCVPTAFHCNWGGLHVYMLEYAKEKMGLFYSFNAVKNKDKKLHEYHHELLSQYIGYEMYGYELLPMNTRVEREGH